MIGRHSVPGVDTPCNRRQDGGETGGNTLWVVAVFLFLAVVDRISVDPNLAQQCAEVGEGGGGVRSSSVA